MSLCYLYGIIPLSLKLKKVGMITSIKMTGKQAKSFWMADWAALAGHELKDVAITVWVEDEIIFVNDFSMEEGLEIEKIKDTDLVLITGGYLKSDPRGLKETSFTIIAARWLRLNTAEFTGQSTYSAMLPAIHRDKLAAFLEKHAGKFVD